MDENAQQSGPRPDPTPGHGDYRQQAAQHFGAETGGATQQFGAETSGPQPTRHAADTGGATQQFGAPAPQPGAPAPVGQPVAPIGQPAAPVGEPGWPGPQPPAAAPQWPPVPPGYGPPPGPRLDLGALGLRRIAAVVVVAAGLMGLIASLFSLYTITVVPSAAQVPNNDAPRGEVHVGIGFYDVVPVLAPSIVAQAIPVLLVLAALCAVGVLLGRDDKTSPLAAVFAGTAALLAVVLTVSNPLPSVELTGDLLTEFQHEVGAQNVDALVDSVGSIGPGAGLIIALLFALVGWAAAVVMVFKRAPAGPAVLPAPPGTPYPPAPPYPPQQPAPPQW